MSRGGGGKCPRFITGSCNSSFDMSSELSPSETVCMDCQNLFFCCFFFLFFFCGDGGEVKSLTLNLFHSLG